MIVDLLDLAALPGAGSNAVSQSLRRLRRRGAELEAQRLQEPFQGLVGTERTVAAVGRDQVDLHAAQLFGPRHFGLDARQLRRHQPRRHAAFAGQFQLRPAASFHDQPPRRNQGSEFRVAELFEQAEHVAVDGLLPESAANRSGR